jgi:hypothetical protein
MSKKAMLTQSIPLKKFPVKRIIEIKSWKECVPMARPVLKYAEVAEV